jgi:ankyrin repeat protein
LVKAYLLKLSWFVYDFDHSLSTPLHIAAKRGLFQLVEILLDNKADPNAVDFVIQFLIFS